MGGDTNSLLKSLFCLSIQVRKHLHDLKLQVETIGDAYCVAGGLHKESETHAVHIALMALKMLELSDEVMTPTGDPIQVRAKHCFL